MSGKQVIDEGVILIVHEAGLKRCLVGIEVREWGAIEITRRY